MSADAVDPAEEPEVVSVADMDAAWIAVAERFREKFDVAAQDMGEIFGLRGEPSYEERVARGSLSEDSDAWHRMASYLLQLMSLTTGLLQHSPNATELRRKWLYAVYPNSREGKTRLQIMKEGDFAGMTYIIEDLQPPTAIEHFAALE